MNLQKRQIAKFHMPLADENHKQLYVVLQVIEEDGRPTADIQSLNLGLSFPPINNSFRRFLSGISQHPRFN
jgi:hypothetical protein